jgi:hypothetical protein
MPANNELELTNARGLVVERVEPLRGTTRPATAGRVRSSTRVFAGPK